MHSDTQQKVPSGGSETQASLAGVPFRQRYKRFVANGLFHSGLLHAIRRFECSHFLRFGPGSFIPRVGRFPRSKFGILCYHRVGVEGVPYHSRLQPRTFDAQMSYLKKYYRVIPLSQMCREIEEGRVVPPTIAITFDDGYRDLYTYAFPILRRLQIPATIYLIGDCMLTGMPPWYDRVFSSVHCAVGPSLEVAMSTSRTLKIDTPSERSAAAWEIVCYLRSLDDRDRRLWCEQFERSRPVHSDELQDRMLDWQQVREMSQAGMYFGAHTWTHPSVSRLSPHALDRELGETKSFLEAELNTEIPDFAYPFGKTQDCSRSAESVLAKNRYRSAVTTSEGINSSETNILRLKRLQIGEDSSLPLFALAVAQMFLESVEDIPVQAADGNQVAERMTKSLKELN
jgi:peptidoglycan/xylan/chitin deacetylase (PgdA/CDA1 family)